MEKILGFILDTISVLFTIIFIIIAFISSHNTKFDTNLIREYKNNWETGPIIDIIKTNSDCPYGYEPFISNKFPGITDGCDCTTSKSKRYSGKIFDKVCDQHQIIKNCNMIFAKQDVELSIWRGSKICIKRMKKDFWSLNIVGNDDKCKKGMKKCGVIDTFNNRLCINSDEKCPINDIVILPVNSSYNYKFQKWHKISLEDNYNFYFTNTNIKNPIIVQLEARDHPICVHPYEGKFGQNEYILNTLKGKPDCETVVDNKLTDQRFQLVDSESQIQFYKENNVDRVIRNLPNYKQPDSDDKVGIFKINYFGWDKKCFNQYEFVESNLVAPQKEVDDTGNLAHILSIICLVYFLFVLIAFLVVKFLIHNMRVSEQYRIITYAFNFLFLIVIMVFACLIYVNVDNILRPHNIFIEHHCGDEITDKVMDYSFRGISSVKGLLVTIMILASFEMGYVIFLKFWIWAFEEKY